VENGLADLRFPFSFPLAIFSPCNSGISHQGSVTDAPSTTDGAEHGPSTSAPSPSSGDVIKGEEETPAADAEAGAEEVASAPAPMDVDKEKPGDESKSQTPVPASQPTPQQQQPQQSQQQKTGQGSGPASQQTSKEAVPQIDLFLEASKLPLDVAIFNSTRAAGGDDKIRKYLQAVLVVGGTALTPGMAHALESRFVRLLLCFILFYCHEYLVWEGSGVCRGDKVLFCSISCFSLEILFWNGSDNRCWNFFFW
jgi:actin-related protein